MEAVGAQTGAYVPVRIGPPGGVVVLCPVIPTLLARNESVIVFKGG